MKTTVIMRPIIWMVAIIASIGIIVESAAYTSSLILVAPPSNIMYISQWRLLGPFQGPAELSDEAAVAQEVSKDYLRSWNSSEETITSRVAAHMCVLNNKCRSYTPTGYVVPLYEMIREARSSVIYAVASIRCSHSMTVVLDINVIPGAVWLNGNRVLSFAATDRGGTGPQTRRLLPLHLISGVNNLLIKTVGRADQRDWVLSAGIVSEATGEQLWLARRSGNLLTRHLLATGESIQMVTPSVAGSAPVNVSLLDIDNAVRYEHLYPTWPASISTKALPTGYYSIRVSSGGVAATDELYAGDVAAQIRALGRERATGTIQQDLQLAPLMQRYAILMSSQYFHPLDDSWQRKMVLVAKNAVLAHRFENTATTWTATSGFHFREYISRLDGSRQPYLVYIPKTVPTILPLVIEMPYATKIVRPFLESGLAVGYPDALNDVAVAADRAEVAVAVIDGRGNAGFSAMGESDAFEVIVNLMRDLPIDSHRIYLYGTCEGGARALKLAEDYPSVFAGVSVYGPAIDTTENWTVHVMLRKQGVFADLSRLRRVPVHIDEGQFDDVPSRSALNEFAIRMRLMDGSAVIGIVKDGLHGTNAAEARAFPWLMQFQSGSSRATVDAATNDILVKAGAEMQEQKGP